MGETMRADIEPTCQNCDFEEYCKHDQPKPCVIWRPDLDYKKLMEAFGKQSDGR